VEAVRDLNSRNEARMLLKTKDRRKNRRQVIGYRGNSREVRMDEQRRTGFRSRELEEGSEASVPSVAKSQKVATPDLRETQNSRNEARMLLKTKNRPEQLGSTGYSDSPL
jgi:hypothetical protein